MDQLRKRILRSTISFVLLITFGIAAGCSAQTVTEQAPPISPTVKIASTSAPSRTPAPQLQASPTPTPTQIYTLTPTPQDSGIPIENIISTLTGLPLEEFFEESYEALTLRDPELVTELGLANEFGVRNDRLNDLSEEYLLDTQKLQSAVLDQLRSYPSASLSEEEQFSYDVYEWYLENQVQGHPYLYHNYPVHHFISGYHFDLDFLLTNMHPIENAQDVEDYIARLQQVDEQVAQLIVGLQKRESLGAIPPLVILEMTTGNMLSYLGSTSAAPQSLPVYTALESKIASLEDLTDDEKRAYLDSAQDAIVGSFIPAYTDLIDYLEDLKSSATNEAGVHKIADGEEYYSYLLRKETSTNLTADEIHTMGLAGVERIRGEMHEVFMALGLSQDDDFSSLMTQAIDVCGYMDGTTQSGRNQVVRTYEEILEEVDSSMEQIFDIQPETQVIVVPENFGGGGFYVGAPADGSRPGEFHAGVGGSRIPKFNMATIAYHEAIPGHHFQIAIAQEQELPTFRNQITFNGYVEGWALYAERLAWELGMYEDDPCGNLGRLQLEILRAVRLVTDTGIHTLGWTREEAQSYMRESMGAGGGGWVHEVDRYIVWPAQSTGYMVGMLKILELRQQAEEVLGENFDIREFHNLVLASGSMPLEIMERVVESHIQSAVER